MTPRVALAKDSTRLACRSPSNRPVRKRCTSVKQSIWAGVISRLRIVDAGGEIADGLAQGNGMLAHNRLSITAGRHQIWLELPQPDTGLLCCFRRSENEGSPEGATAKRFSTRGWFPTSRKTHVIERPRSAGGSGCSMPPSIRYGYAWSEPSRGKINSSGCCCASSSNSSATTV